MNKKSFWQLLKNNKIEIPIMQRDYVQGREGKEYLRQSFLESLKNALDDEKYILKLDFVYGSMENGRLYPLDGQQRLTTLWLLHWYIALRADELNAAAKILQNFTYETRISSREFCKQMCKPSNFRDTDCKQGDIVAFITSQIWFYSIWKQDPTIQSMLRMLGGTQSKKESKSDIVDGIEGLFGRTTDFSIYQSYWKKLTSDTVPIVFYYLSLEDFGLSDDLYIKMNARGKQLSNFENFKADLVRYIQEKLANDSNLIQNGIPIKLDTEWTDIFWQNRTEDGKIDEIYFEFLNCYFLHYAIANLGAGEKSKIWKLYGDKPDDSSLSYNKGFQMYSDVIEEKVQEEKSQVGNTLKEASKKRNLLERLSSLFERLKEIGKKNSNKPLNEMIMSALPVWFPKFDFIPQYKKEKNNYVTVKDSFGNTLYQVTTLTQPQRVVFFGICRYLEECEQFDENNFRRWMRVVCNLTENNTISDIDAMRSRIKLINELSSHCTDIYSFLSNETSEIKSDAANDQLLEEIAKAKQIYSACNNSLLPVNSETESAEEGRTWETVIIEAENYAFFKGAIRFLFRNANGKWDWSQFGIKWQNAQQYFDANGIKDHSATQQNWRKADLLKSLISMFTQENFWNVLWWNHRTFNNYPATWKYYLLNRQICEPVHTLLSMASVSIKERTLDNFIENKTIYYLANTYLLDFVIEKIPDSWIRFYLGKRLAIYPSKEGVLLDAEIRNEFLLTTKNIILEENYKIGNSGLLFGWNIPFKYERDSIQYNCRWDYDNKIYLLNDGNIMNTTDVEGVLNVKDVLRKLNDLLPITS